MHNIDPSGDVLIILKTPSGPFVPWGEETESSPKSEPAHTNTKPKVLKARVSSAVLRHASRVFAKEFDPSGPWKEPPVQPDGLVHKELEGFYPSALVHVLNIIHFRNNLVPTTLPVEEIAKVAVIVDYLQCHHAVTFAVRSWIQGYKKSSPDTFSRTDFLWLFVSSVFNNAQIFEPIASRAVKFGMEPFETHGLPVPERVVGEEIHMQRECSQEALIFVEAILDGHRNQALGNLMTGLYKFHDFVLSDENCTEECNAWQLGALLTCMACIRMYPKPTTPFSGVSIHTAGLMLDSLSKMISEDSSDAMDHCTEYYTTCGKTRHFRYMTQTFKRDIAVKLR